MSFHSIPDIKVPYERFSVSIGECVGSKDELWTLSMNTESTNVPIVMLHGFAAGLLQWPFNAI